jgi:putative transposase
MPPLPRRSKPLLIVSENCTELTSAAILGWAQETQIGCHYTSRYIAPDKPTQNAFVESFNGGLRVTSC